MAIQELNLRSDDKDTPTGIPDYTLIQDKLLEKNGLSRAGLLLHKDVKYKIRWDLTDTEAAHVAITVYTSKNKKFTSHAWYRQWQEITFNKKIPLTGTVQAQKRRLVKTAQFFKKLKLEGETIILTDSNVNTQNIEATDNQKTTRDKQTAKITQTLSESPSYRKVLLSLTHTNPQHNN